MLTSSVEFATYHVKKGLWTKATMNAYLRTCAVASRVRDGVWASVKGDVRDKEDNDCNTDDEIDDGYMPITRSDDEYIPKLWYSRMAVNSFVDCGMHLIFHGVLATIVETVDVFVTDKKLGMAFERTVNEYLLEIKCLRVEWCKLKPMPKKQWLAENELGLARIMPFVYLVFLTVLIG